MLEHPESSDPQAVTSSPGASPVAGGERIAELDVLRGFALLGILVINIEFFALPSAIYFNPAAIGGFAGLDLLTWKFGAYFFLQKMMAIFSMLFGAGMVLMTERWQGQGSKPGRLFYRRNLWLLAIGLIHAYLIWHGDILVAYALCAFLLYLFRKRSIRALIITGAVFLLIGMIAQLGVGFQFRLMRDMAQKVEQAELAQQPVERYQEALASAWRMIDSVFTVTPERLETEIADFRGDYGAVLSRRAPESVMMQTHGFLFYSLWRSLGMMLLGMALLKAGVLTGLRPLRFYVILGAIGYGIGLPLTVIATNSSIAHQFDFVNSFLFANQMNYLGSILVALGHVAVLLVVCKNNWLKSFRLRLAEVGRTAFSNYLLQSLICTTLFYGYGFGLFARLNRLALFGVVIGVWLINIFATQAWLKRFRLGPAEWLWRSLTYRRAQPMRLSARQD